LSLDPAYPRPLLQRSAWSSLNGPWHFAIDRSASWQAPDEVVFDRVIQVPFAPETEASGIAEKGYFTACWYRRRFAPPPLAPGHRLLLHFGAVDYEATVWIGGALAGGHEGGYTPFTIDATNFLRSRDSEEIVVRAVDDPLDLAKPRGKQDWLPEPHSIWYPRTSGIWQTVWLEVVPPSWIASLRWTPNIERWELGLEARIEGPSRRDLWLDVRLRVGSQLLADDSYALVGPELRRRIALSDPGIDDSRNELLWSPDSPTLIHARLRLRGEGGEPIDEALSYTALRSVAVQGERMVLNGRPLALRMVLDQGYWPQTGLTAPDEAALRRDVELTRQMGFNGARKHQKIEDPRYLYWADRLGLVVWEEMPSVYRFTTTSVERLARQWLEVLRRDESHPCIVAWVPFNESWGVPNLPETPAERHFVQALYHLTKTVDPTRPVVGNDGWEAVATDIIGIHDYEDDTDRLRRRYESQEVIPHLFRRERPGGRVLAIEGHPPSGQPIMLTECGGISFAEHDTPATSWGYSRAATPEEFRERYTRLLSALRSVPMLAGFCYTQFADTYQENNGLLYADRRPKIALDDIATATRGPRKYRDEVIERQWRERMLRLQAEHG
jgi:beta-galactosidase/beta-glucuronidase